MSTSNPQTVKFRVQAPVEQFSLGRTNCMIIKSMSAMRSILRAELWKISFRIQLSIKKVLLSKIINMTSIYKHRLNSQHEIKHDHYLMRVLVWCVTVLFSCCPLHQISPEKDL